MNDPAAPPPDRTPVQTESDVAFPRLDEAQMATMVAAGRTEKVDAGQDLFLPGDLDFDLILVVSGCVEILDEADSPRERVLVTYGAAPVRRRAEPDHDGTDAAHRPGDRAERGRLRQPRGAPRRDLA